MININEEILNKISQEINSRKRKNYNYHTDLSDTLQRFLNAIEPDTYIQPHKHEDPDKREVFIILRGKAVVVEFDENGKIKDKTILDPTINYGVEIPSKIYHTIISLEENTVVYEIKDGPYEVPNDKNFAKWAPEEGKPETVSYLSNILKELNIK